MALMPTTLPLSVDQRASGVTGIQVDIRPNHLGKSSATDPYLTHRTAHDPDRDRAAHAQGVTYSQDQLPHP